MGVNKWLKKYYNLWLKAITFKKIIFPWLKAKSWKKLFASDWKQKVVLKHFPRKTFSEGAFKILTVGWKQKSYGKKNLKPAVKGKTFSKKNFFLVVESKICARSEVLVESKTLLKKLKTSGYKSKKFAENSTPSSWKKTCFPVVKNKKLFKI